MKASDRTIETPFRGASRARENWSSIRTSMGGGEPHGCRDSEGNGEGGRALMRVWRGVWSPKRPHRCSVLSIFSFDEVLLTSSNLEISQLISARQRLRCHLISALASSHLNQSQHSSHLVSAQHSTALRKFLEPRVFSVRNSAPAYSSKLTALISPLGSASALISSKIVSAHSSPSLTTAQLKTRQTAQLRRTDGRVRRGTGAVSSDCLNRRESKSKTSLRIVKQQYPPPLTTGNFL